MKNKKSLLIGIIISLFAVFFLNGIFQSLFLMLFNTDIEKFHFSMSGFSPNFQLNDCLNIYLNSFLLLLPIIINLVFLEISLMLLSKFPQDIYRFSTIVFVLFLVGYFIIFTFYGLIELLLNSTSNSVWSKLTMLWVLEGTKIYVFIIFVLVALFTYLQFVQKRLMQYLTVLNSGKTKPL